MSKRSSLLGRCFYPWVSSSSGIAYLITMTIKVPVLQEAFAVVREASKRVIGLRPFDVQLIGKLLCVYCV
jgi:hypothetical protein